MFPNQVDFSLHIICMSRDSNNSVFFRKHEYELSVCTICSEGVVAAAPHLISVTL